MEEWKNGKKQTYKQAFSQGGIYYMKEGCPVYKFAFMRDQTQDHKTWTIRHLDGTAWDRKRRCNNFSRGRLAILESPYHLIREFTRINKDSVRLIKVTLTLVKQLVGEIFQGAASTAWQPNRPD